ncbi:hypothetical protein NLG97_g2703 [Lecanicillium saksenae]|uniref:Uncharacterized protein n=1 Tax=Lecanicillium saksenae TaxID=468837 RepID=A0ACC1R1K5_9HYPO|nr:hypothetical protein NLG97_g2703 [Lecanicillium saksenae]
MSRQIQSKDGMPITLPEGLTEVQLSSFKPFNTWMSTLSRTLALQSDAAHPATVREKEANTYWPWIENYGAADYVEAVRLGSDLIERNIRLCSPARIDELVKIFIHGTRMEIGFWEMFPAK